MSRIKRTGWKRTVHRSTEKIVLALIILFSFLLITGPALTEFDLIAASQNIFGNSLTSAAITILPAITSVTTSVTENPSILVAPTISNLKLNSTDPTTNDTKGPLQNKLPDFN